MGFFINYVGYFFLHSGHTGPACQSRVYRHDRLPPAPTSLCKSPGWPTSAGNYSANYSTHAVLMRE